MWGEAEECRPPACTVTSGHSKRPQAVREGRLVGAEDTHAQALLTIYTESNPDSINLVLEINEHSGHYSASVKFLG